MKSVLPCGPGLAERWPVCVTRKSGQNGYSDQKRHVTGHWKCEKTAIREIQHEKRKEAKSENT